MAIGNPIMSKLRGNLGGMRYSVSRGRQIVAARNTSATQTNTYARVAQKVKLAPVVKFYKAAQSNFFEFAFSQKRKEQTDYNAFCSYNMNIAPYLTKQENELWKAYPAPFIVSDGTLGYNFTFHDFLEGEVMPSYKPFLIADTCHALSASPAYNVAGCFTPIDESYAADDVWTVGQLSGQLMVDFGLQEGDKVTFLSIMPYSIEAQVGQVSYNSAQIKDLTWDFQSIIIDESNTTRIPKVENVPLGSSALCWAALHFGNGNNVAFGVCSSAISEDNERFDGGGMSAIIITRRDGSKILANKAVLRMGYNDQYSGYSSGQLWVDKRTNAALYNAVLSYGYQEAPLDPSDNVVVE